jgi:hypothetical protein
MTYLVGVQFYCVAGITIFKLALMVRDSARLTGNVRFKGNERMNYFKKKNGS